MSLLELLYCLAIVAVMVFLILKWRAFQLPGIKKKWVLAAFFLKVAAGLAMTYIYTYYYEYRVNADIFRYFDDGEVMYQSIKSEPGDYVKMVSGIHCDEAMFDSLYYKKMNGWHRQYESVVYNDSHTIIRVNALIRLVSFGYFQVHNLIFIILSFIGMMALFKTFSKYFINKSGWLYAAVFLIPSVAFWSSGAMKEAILFFAMGVFFYAAQQLLFISVTLPRVLLAAVCIGLLLLTKVYVLVVLIPVFLANLWIVLSGNRHSFFKHMVSLLVFINIAILIGRLFPDYNMFELIVTKLHDFTGLAQFVNAGSFIEPVPLKADFLSFLLNSPQAIVNTLFRPYPNEISSMMMIPVLIENILLIIFILLALFFHSKKINNSRIIWLCLFFSLVLSIIAGLTTPVLGALVRYRIPVLPFLFIALFLIIDFKKIGAFLHIKTSVSDE